MTTDSMEPKIETDKVVSLVSIKKAKLEQGDMSTEEYIVQGLETLTHEVNNGSKGFFSIVFDKNGDPKIIWVGDYNMLTAIGALEYAKHEFMANLVPVDVE